MHGRGGGRLRTTFDNFLTSSDLKEACYNISEQQPKKRRIPMETAADNELLNKFRAVAQGPDKELLQKFLDVLYERVGEEYDTEPLSQEEREMITESEGQFERGEYLTLEEYRGGKRL
jgi:hypothetical protein